MTAKPTNFRLHDMSKGNKRPWSDDDMRYVLAHHKNMFLEDIAEQLNRTEHALENKASHMGCSLKSKPKVSNV